MRKIALAFLAIMALAATLSFAEVSTEYKQAVEAYNNGQYEAAIAILKDYAKKRPEAPAYYFIGYAYYKLGKFDEAGKYFDYAFLVDPEYSPTPELVERGTWPPGKRGGPVTEDELAPAMERARQVVEELKAAITPAMPEPEAEAPKAEEAAPEPTPVVKPEVPQPVEPAPAPAVEPEAPQPAEPAPPPAPEAAAAPPVKVTPWAIPAFQGEPREALIAVIISILFYIYYCLCLYRIANRLAVPAAWTAWIPLIQVWPFVGSAGKPWWWILLLLVPFLNVIIIVYLWMCITENLGRNKLLGLLTLVPIVNIIYPGFLAFAKAKGESSRGMTMGPPSGMEIEQEGQYEEKESS